MKIKHLIATFCATALTTGGTLAAGAPVKAMGGALVGESPSRPG